MSSSSRERRGIEEFPRILSQSHKWSKVLRKNYNPNHLKIIIKNYQTIRITMKEQELSLKVLSKLMEAFKEFNKKVYMAKGLLFCD